MGPPATARLVAFVGTADLERSHAFYGGVLGLTRVEASGFANAYDAGGTSLRVTRVDEPARAPYTVLGWWVADLDATVAALRGRGVAFRHYPGLDQDPEGVWTSPGGARIAWFQDPDGNTISVGQEPGKTAAEPHRFQPGHPAEYS